MTFLLTLQLDILFPQVALETEELYDVSPVPLLGNAEESELEWMRTTRMGGAGRILQAVRKRYKNFNSENNLPLNCLAHLRNPPVYQCTIES